MDFWLTSAVKPIFINFSTNFSQISTIFPVNIIGTTKIGRSMSFSTNSNQFPPIFQPISAKFRLFSRSILFALPKLVDQCHFRPILQPISSNFSQFQPFSTNLGSINVISVQFSSNFSQFQPFFRSILSAPPKSEDQCHFQPIFTNFSPNFSQFPGQYY